MACLRLEGEENLGTWPYREKIWKIVYVKDDKHFRARSERGSHFFFCKILEGPTSCPCPAQRERGNGTGLVKGNRKREKKSSLKSHFVIKNQYIFIYKYAKDTYREGWRSKVSWCENWRGGWGGQEHQKNKVYNILTVPWEQFSSLHLADDTTITTLLQGSWKHPHNQGPPSQPGRIGGNSCREWRSISLGLGETDRNRKPAN